MPGTIETTRFIEYADRILEGSPYLIRDDDVGRSRAAAIRSRLDELGQVQLELRGRALPDLGRMHRTREVFESNAIEGAGLPLNETVEILDAQEGRTASGVDYAQWALLEGIRRDTHAYEVIGLDAARTLARDMAKDLSRPVHEADIRQLHQVIMGTDAVGGRYKRHHVTILGATHEPPPPIETPVHMKELTGWLNGSASRVEDLGGAVIRAAAAHAWFAHVHPFEDGNGRVARLLANLALAAAQGPPLIVRSQADRTEYIDALAVSDEAGDIARLVVVLGKYLTRTASEYLEPSVAEAAFAQDLEERTSSDYEWWSGISSRFIREAAAALRKYGIDLNPVGRLAPGDFEYLKVRNMRGNSWAAKLSQSGQPLGLLWYGYAPDAVTRFLEHDQIYPALFLAASNSEPTAAHPYHPLVNFGSRPYSFMIEPPLTVWAVSRKGLDRLDIEVAADLLADSVYAMSRADPSEIAAFTTRG